MVCGGDLVLREVCSSYRILSRSGRDVSSRRSPLARILWRMPQCAAIIIRRCLAAVVGVAGRLDAAASRNTPFPGHLPGLTWAGHAPTHRASFALALKTALGHSHRGRPRAPVGPLRLCPESGRKVRAPTSVAKSQIRTHALQQRSGRLYGSVLVAHPYPL
jgi:hypothetical protein